MHTAATASRARATLPHRRANRAKLPARLVRDRFHSGQAGEVKLASATLVLSRAPGDERAEQDREQKCAAAANDHRQQDRQNSATGVRFVGARQPDAVEDNFPNSDDESPAERNHKQWINRSAGEANHSKGSLKGLFRTADDHQAKVENCRADKGSDNDEDWRQN